MVPRHFAHSLPGRPPEKWQSLTEHLLNVAELASKFAESFGGGSFAYLAGLWHDLGKYSNAFQEYLKSNIDSDAYVRESTPGTDHSTAGAQHAVDSRGILGHLLAYVIAGHHSGLLDGRSDRACLDARLKKQVRPWRHGLEILPEGGSIELPGFLRKAFGADGVKDGFSVSFFTRMLFSCLVDADSLDTEAFMDPEKAASRPIWGADVLPAMNRLLELYIQSLNPPPSEVNKIRNDVRDLCIQAAGNPTGFFSLTVPTGGGKTLSSLAFALRHGVEHGLKRVIYVVPFTSIIEQNAAEFRKVMAPLSDRYGADVVLEHHCSVDVEKMTLTSQLMAENWDAPLIVTTSVQFYESLFSSKRRRTRKLHRLAESIIILDEVQALPVDYLHPCLRTLEELVRNYRSSIVLCTATQPALNFRNDFPIGIRNVREIIPRPRHLYQKLKRVRIIDLGSVADEDLASRLQGEKQVLCIVNTRRHARILYELLGESEDHYHLSAAMCPAHRSLLLRWIRRRLKRGLPCRVISTQLVEAGVDIDFPAVFRSLAGLDSIAQAAGRCNREGRLADTGRTYIFRSEHKQAERYFSDTADAAAQVLSLFEDPLDLDAIERYFQLYYWEQSARWDSKRILDNFHLLNDRSFPFSFGFQKTSETFRLIETDQRAVLIPWRRRGWCLCENLRMWAKPDRILLRELQRYSVQIPLWEWSRLNESAAIELVHTRFPILISPELYYSDLIGLNFSDAESTFLEA